MLRKTYTLEVDECQVTGNLGIFIRGVNLNNFEEEPFFVAHVDDLIAHDIFEHQRGIGKIGTVYDELLALGALWYTRGQFGYLRADAGDPLQGIMADIVGLSEAIARGHGSLRIPRQPPTDFDDVFELVCEETNGGISAAWDCDDNSPDVEDFLEQCKRGMQRGVHLIQRKYPSARDANRIFWEIAATVKPAFQRLKEDIAEQGDRFLLRQHTPFEWSLKPLTNRNYSWQ